MNTLENGLLSRLALALNLIGGLAYVLTMSCANVLYIALGSAAVNASDSLPSTKQPF